MEKIVGKEFSREINGAGFIEAALWAGIYDDRWQALTQASTEH